MITPILKQGEILIATIQSSLTDSDLAALRDDLMKTISRERSRGIIIDVTVLEVIDSFACWILQNLARMARLRGAETVLVGISPGVAFSMVQLGLTLEGIHILLDLEEGLAYLNENIGKIRH